MPEVSVAGPGCWNGVVGEGQLVLDEELARDADADAAVGVDEVVADVLEAGEVLGVVEDGHTVAAEALLELVGEAAGEVLVVLAELRRGRRERGVELFVDVREARLDRRLKVG